jgi:hypothetical protein
MRPALILTLSVIVAIGLSGCGSSGTQTSVGNANQGTSNTAPASTNTGGSAGSGPQNQGIGGTGPANTSTVNGNPRIEPPGPVRGGSPGNTRP